MHTNSMHEQTIPSVKENPCFNRVMIKFSPNSHNRTCLLKIASIPWAQQLLSNIAGKSYSLLLLILGEHVVLLLEKGMAQGAGTQFNATKHQFCRLQSFFEGGGGGGGGGNQIPAPKSPSENDYYLFNSRFWHH